MTEQIRMPSPTFRVGTAKRDITPTDLENINPAGGNFAGVHDPLYVRVVVLDDGDTVAAIAALDLLEIGDMTEVLNRVEAEVGIPAGNVLLVGSHSHNAPRVGLVSPGALALASRPEFEAYGAGVFDAVIDAFRAALEARQPARLATGTGHVDVNVNRDQYVAGTWIDGLNEAGPSDKALRVLRLEGMNGAPLALLLNYPVHCTVAAGTGEVSGDLAGHACTFIEEHLGSDAVALWMTGALGDQGPRIRYSDFMGGAGLDSEFAWTVVAAQATMIGAEAVRVNGLSPPVEGPVRLAVDQRTLSFPTQQGNDDRDDRTHARVDCVDLPISLVRLNDLVLCGAGGEVAEGVAAAIRAASPLRETWVVSLVNNRVGYIVTDEAYLRRTFESVRSPIAEGHAEGELARAFASMISESLTQRP